LALVAARSKLGLSPTQDKQEKTPLMDLIDDPREGQNSPEFTVTELSGAIKRVIEGEFGHVGISILTSRTTVRLFPV